MFEQILKELKTKYANLGLSEAILKVKANQLAKTVKEESEIENAVIGVEDDLKIYQSISDVSRTKVTELEKVISELKNGKTDEKQEDKKEESKSEDMPAWAKAIIDANTKMTETLSGIQQKESNISNAQKLADKLKELNVSDNFSKFQVQGKTFANDEEIMSFATSLQEAETNYKQSLNDGKAETFANPIFGKVAKEGGVSSDVQSFIDSTFKPKS